jgi:hypothetical protein
MWSTKYMEDQKEKEEEESRNPLLFVILPSQLTWSERGLH